MLTKPTEVLWFFARTLRQHWAPAENPFFWAGKKRLRALASLPCLVLRTHNPLQPQLWGIWQMGPESTHIQRHINKQKANIFKSWVPWGFTEKLFPKCPVAVKGGAAFENVETPSRPFSLLRCKALTCFYATNHFSKQFLRGNPHSFFLPSWARLWLFQIFPLCFL